MVLATFTHYVRNLFGGGGATSDVKEAPHEVRKGDDVVEVSAKADDKHRPGVATRKVPATAGANSDEGPPSAEESTDESGTEEVAVAGTSPESSSPAKRKRANKKTSNKDSNVEDSVPSGNAKTDDDTDDPPSASGAKGEATAPPTDASAAASPSDARKAVVVGSTASRGSKRPRREATKAAS